MSYASAMIAALRLERDAERTSHNRTRQQADSRIANLEAQLAIREAELEACVVHTGITIQKANAPQSFPPQTVRTRYGAAFLAEEKIIRDLELDSARSKPFESDARSSKDHVRLSATRMTKFPSKERLRQHLNARSKATQAQIYPISEDYTDKHAFPAPSTSKTDPQSHSPHFFVCQVLNKRLNPVISSALGRLVPAGIPVRHLHLRGQPSHLPYTHLPRHLPVRSCDLQTLPQPRTR
jgi:hypothetical protein